MSRRLAHAAALSALALFGLPAAAPAVPPTKSAAPAKQETRPLIEMVFVLDTTGSMGGLIEGAKQRIWDIVNGVMATPAERRPEVRIGLVAYRDNTDDYVTQVTPLSRDLDAVYQKLMGFQAGGGGDMPENVRRGLSYGVKRAGWASGADAAGRKVARFVFLVGDAPPQPYPQETDVVRTAGLAVERGIVVNAIQCGEDSATREVWQSVARRGRGQFFAIAQDGGVQSIATPYDAKLAQLGAKMGGTYVAFGGGAGARGDSYRAAAAAKARGAESSIAAEVAARPAAAPAAAGRAVNKALNSYAYDSDDLLTAVENKSVALDKVKAEDLPADLRKLSPKEREATVQKRLAERKALRAEILALSKKRDAYTAAERRKRSGGKQTGFDAAVSAALKEQASRRGIRL